MEYKITTHSEEETMEIAQNLESEKFPGMVICLNGELGSGKTVFVKGFAVGLGITETITSPTFNIVKEYLDGKSLNNLYQTYGVAKSTIAGWIKKYSEECQYIKPHNKEKNASSEEIRALNKKIKELEKENDF